MIRERRMSVLVAAVAVFLWSALLWHLFVRPPRERQRPVPPPPPPPVASSAAVTPAALPDSAPLPRPAGANRVPAAVVPADPGLAGTSYLVLMARPEALPTIRARTGLPCMTDIIAKPHDPSVNP